MLMPNETPTSTTIQTTARRLLVAASLVMAIGLAGVVTAKVQNEKSSDKSKPSIRFISTAAVPPIVMGVAQDSLDEAQLAVATIEAGIEDAAEAIVTPQEPSAAFRTIRMEVTAYCACKKCCGPNAQGITASGKLVSYNGGKFVAADTRLLPFGTKLQVPGYHNGETVEVIDRGGAIKGNKLDLYFDSHQTALEWGRQWVDVTILE